MKRAVPWIIAAIAFIAFVASFSELQRMRKRFDEVTRQSYHDHRDVREFIIRAALDGIKHPIVVMGDSITEMATLPEAICGKPVVNAGIGGATIADFIDRAPRLLSGASRPSLIIVALGANSIGSGTVREDYAALLSELKGLSPSLLVIGITPMAGATAANVQIKEAASGEGVSFLTTAIPRGMTIDGIHLNAEARKLWARSITEAACSVLD